MAETIPETVTEVEADLCYSAPNPPPTQWADYIRKNLDPRLFEIYTANRVPWQILKTMADDGWTGVGSVAARFLAAEAGHERAATSLQLEKLDPTQLEKALARLVAAQEDLSLHEQHKRKLENKPTSLAGRGIHRPKKKMEKAFTEDIKEACPLCNQGSKHLLRNE
jgi:hypothetical protein